VLSIPDMALLGAAALLLFGPEQLPRVARKAGNVMREIQNTSQSFIREMERAADLHDEAEAKAKAPPYDPAPYGASVYDAEAPTTEFSAVEPAAPDPEPPEQVGEKLAEPRLALNLAEPPEPDPEPVVLRPADRSTAAQPPPQVDHSAHL
jgi:sec-independent protein translocase protein TatA